MNSIKKQVSQIEASLFDSLLNDYVFKQEENLKSDHNLEKSQEYKMAEAEALDFLNEVPNENLLLDEVESVSSYEENEEKFMEEKDNVIETQECFTEENEFEFVGHVKMNNKEEFMLKEEIDVEIEEQIMTKKQNFKSIFKERKLKGEWKKNTNVPKFLVRIFMKHFSNFITGQSSEEILNHHRKMKKILQSRVSNNYSISDVLSLLRSEEFCNKSLSFENQRILSQIIQKTLQSEVVENKYIKNNQMSYMMAIKLYAIRCRCSSLTERVKLF